MPVGSYGVAMKRRKRKQQTRQKNREPSRRMNALLKGPLQTWQKGRLIPGLEQRKNEGGIKQIKMKDVERTEKRASSTADKKAKKANA